MESGDAVRLGGLVVLLMLSAFFSSSETSLVTVNKVKIRTLAEEGNERAKLLEKIFENQAKMLSAILIGNNLVNIGASAIATELAIKWFGSAATGIVTGILTLLVLIFGEISPKTAATIHAEKISFFVAPIIWTLMKVLTSIIFIINLLSGGFLRLLGIDPNQKKELMTEEELRTIVDVSHEDGVLETEERQMIRNVVDFGDAQAKDVMVPRLDMTFADVDATYEELIQLFREDRFTRIPVYEGSSDNVIGIVNMKDLLLYRQDTPFCLRDYLRKPYYTFESKNTLDLLKEMRESAVNITIVLDEYGVTAGLVTLEDLLEEIVGEIRDEYDEGEADPIVMLSEDRFRILGLTTLDDINEALDLELEAEENDTIGGYIIEHLEYFPRAGEKLVKGNLEFQVERAARHRIESIILTISHPSEEA